MDLGNFAKPYIVDCLGKEVFLDELKNAFENNVIKLYTKMERWRADKLKGFENFKQTDNMLSAQISDSDEIIKLLNDTFDSYVSHLPTEEKLKKLIKNNLLFYIKENNKIIAAFCFEKFANENFYVYQIAVHKNFRGCGLGKKVVHYALSNYKNKKFILAG